MTGILRQRPARARQAVIGRMSLRDVREWVRQDRAREFLRAVADEASDEYAIWLAGEVHRMAGEGELQSLGFSFLFDDDDLPALPGLAEEEEEHG